MQRFLAADLTAARPGELRSLDDDEAHHLRNVLRGREGDVVELFDGSGKSCRAVVHELSRRSAQVRIEELPRAEAMSRPELWLAVAPPKLDRFRWLVEKATELGVARLMPLLTQRTVVTPGEGKISRLQSAVVQACKQCGRNTLMTVDEPLSWSDLWTILGTDRTSTPVLITDRTGRAEDFPMKSAGARIVALIGPEGGWTPEELHAAREQGASPISLSRFTLRTETAAITVAARWAQELSDP